LLLLFFGFLAVNSLAEVTVFVVAEKLAGNNNPRPKRLVKSSFFIVVVFYYLYNGFMVVLAIIF